MASDEELKYRIALTLLPGIGDVNAKTLVAYCGGAEAVLREKRATLEKIPSIGAITAAKIQPDTVLGRAEAEVEFVRKYNINARFYLDSDYPSRLKHAEDAPVMLYSKGPADLSAPRMVSIVGTRKATPYGKKVTEQIVDVLTAQGIPVVSGMAYGIDICAHRACIKGGLPTVGVLAHGLDRIYPGNHRSAAEAMAKTGALVTDFISDTNPDAPNFPKRNRIIAGLTDVTVVVESKRKGGSLITADIANSYSRDVMAIPGRVDAETSEGCHFLIRNDRARLITSGEDLLYYMSWDEPAKPTWTIQPELFKDLSTEEAQLVKVLKDKGQLSIDSLALEAKLATSVVATSLLNLEFSGVVRSLPGKIYELN